MEDGSLFDGTDSSESVEQTTTESAPQQQEATQSTEQPSEQSTGVTPQQYQELQQKLQAQEQWQNDLKRVFSGEQPQQNQSEQRLEQFVANPDSYIQQQVNQAIQEQNVINSYKQKYPELQQYENYVAVDVQQVIQESQMQGKHITHDQAIEEGINRFRSRFQGLAQDQTKQQQADQAKSLAMTMDLSGGGQKTSSAPDLKSMSKEEFYNQYKARGAYTGF